MTELEVMPAELELLAKNCKSLISLKISDCDLSDLIGFFHSATSLEEFAGGTFNEQGELAKYGNVKFPSRLCSLGLTFMGTNEMAIIFPFSAILKKLDLQYTFLTTEDHCQLIAKCPNLLVLAVMSPGHVNYEDTQLVIFFIVTDFIYIFPIGKECDWR